MVNKQKEHINFVVVTYSLVRVAPYISKMPLYVGSTWFCYSGVQQPRQFNHFNFFFFFFGGGGATVPLAPPLATALRHMIYGLFFVFQHSNIQISMEWYEKLYF